MSEPVVMSVGAHPRARRSVRRARAFGGLLGFAVALLLSLRAGVPAWDATARALIAGIVVHLAAWRVAVAVWRQLMLAELERLRARRLARAEPARGAAEA